MELNKVKNACDWLEAKGVKKPETGLILGSGLGDLIEDIKKEDEFVYDDIPDFPVSTVSDHAGKLVFGKYADQNLVIMNGRCHYYEGYSLKEVVRPVRIMKYMGIKNLIITNAAGSINKNYGPGDIMLITDHLNYSGDNPLRGENIAEFGPRFPDMTTAYTPQLQDLARNTAEDMDMKLKEGVYGWYKGPSFETPTEIKALRKLGADAVGMSTVPEVIAASHMKLNVLGLSCLTNMAAGILDQPLSSEEVLETAQKVKPVFKKLLKNILKEI
ncbi:MAG: purine-nucleoside phosphorylase [Halanaerobiales bacterium]